MSGLLSAATVALADLAGLPAPLVLDGVVFSGCEVPSGIRIGGAQTVILHWLPGGRRLYDVIGPDEDAIEWEGVLIGPLASAKAELLAAMRRDGSVRVLSFGDLVLRVLIVRFEYCYQAQGAITPYRLRAEIVFDPVAALLAAGVGSSLMTSLMAAGTMLAAATTALSGAIALSPVTAPLGVAAMLGQLISIATQVGGLTAPGAAGISDSLWSARTGVESCLASPLTNPISMSSVATASNFAATMVASSISAYGTQARSSIAWAQSFASS